MVSQNFVFLNQHEAQNCLCHQGFTGPFAVFEVSTRIITDRGTAFTSHIFKNFCQEYSIKHVLNAVTTPRANGQCERINRTVLDALSTTCAGEPEATWDQNLKKV